MSEMPQLKCIRCDQEMPNIATKGQQPIGGLAFSTSGHYGSTYFDPMDGSYLEISICDHCVEMADKYGRVSHYPSPPVEKV